MDEISSKRYKLYDMDELSSKPYKYNRNTWREWRPNKNDKRFIIEEIDKLGNTLFKTKGKITLTFN